MVPLGKGGKPGMPRPVAAVENVTEEPNATVGFEAEIENARVPMLTDSLTEAVEPEWY